MTTLAPDKIPSSRPLGAMVPRAVVAGSSDRCPAEEDIARVVGEKLRDLIRMSLGPGPDALHRGLVRCHLVPVNQPARDRAVRVPVLIVIENADQADALHPKLARALNLEEKLINRICEPGDRVGVEIGALINGRAGSVGNQFPAGNLAPDPLSLEFGVERRELHVDQIRRRREDGPGVVRRPGGRRVENRLVVPRHEARGVRGYRGAIRFLVRRDGPEIKILLEEFRR